MNRYSNERVKGFLHALGPIMVNGEGEEVVLRGWGMGNWNNPEGFLIGGGEDFALNLGPDCVRMGRLDRGRSFSQVLKELCGFQYEAEFWKQWHRNYLQEADIRLLAQEGYNSVRLPICARAFLLEEPGIQFIEDAFKMLTQVLDWCEAYGIYAIIDLHGTVGGQSNLPCDDGIDNMPHLFLDEEGEERTIILCEELAKRYKDRWIIGAYNLINEPLSNPVWFHLKDRLKVFYHNLVRGMRRFDRNHLLLLEGYHFSGKLDIFDCNYDPTCNNWGISIHCYEQRPEVATFSHALEVREALQVPVWMGETGGSEKWMGSLFELLLEYHIGFNVWCFKTCAGANAAKTLEFELPKDWGLVTGYAHKGLGKPSYVKSQAIFDDFLEKIKSVNCRHTPSVHDAILRKPGCEVPAVAYNAISVLDEEQPGFVGRYEFHNPFKYRLGDRMKFVLPKDMASGVTIFGNPRPDSDWVNLELVLHDKEQAAYTIRDVAAKCDVMLGYRAAKDTMLRVTIGTQPVGTVDVPASAEGTLLLSSLTGCSETEIRIEPIDNPIILIKLQFNPIV